MMDWNRPSHGVLIPEDIGDDFSRWPMIVGSSPCGEDTVCAWYVIDETGENPRIVASGSENTLEEAMENAESAFKRGGCPHCGSREVPYENPRTGAGAYVCMGCGEILTTQESDTMLLERSAEANAPHEPRRDSGVALDGVVGRSEGA